MEDTEGPYAGCVDRDGDGYYAACDRANDCDDFDPSIPGQEACNGWDDDCDGSTDEGFDIGALCAVGECRGVTVCDLRDWTSVTCANDRWPHWSDEACNGLDDDCDGEIDERSGYTGYACVTDAPGRCAAGVMRCVDGGLACVGQIAPATVDELCNALDDDCDGIIDEAIPEPPCYPGPPGTEGVGACRAGKRRCEVGRHRTCVGAVTPGQERCDGIDEDCDGVVDEGLACHCADGTRRACPPRAPAIAGLGACVEGEQVCVAGRWGRCAGRVDPRPEACDGADDDCDGLIDERASGVDQPCSAGVGQCRGAGSLVCEGGRLRCDAMLGVPQATDLCLGDDLDCDGVEGAPLEVGRPCVENGRDGIHVCDGRPYCLPHDWWAE